MWRIRLKRCFKDIIEKGESVILSFVIVRNIVIVLFDFGYQFCPNDKLSLSQMDFGFWVGFYMVSG
jgi:Na+-transporting NADH:ubiquinone oxidoreductase subunit NqrB